MMTTMIQGVLMRELRALRRELESYRDERDLWKTPPGVTNSAGTLALHLAGNVQAFIGAQLGNSGYVRDRTAEFASRDVPRAELLRQVEAAMAAVEQTLPGLSDAALERDFPMAIGGTTVNTGDFLIHLAAHLAYHLGQLDYHRRMLTGETGSIGAVAPAELSSARKSA